MQAGSRSNRTHRHYSCLRRREAPLILAWALVGILLVSAGSARGQLADESKGQASLQLELRIHPLEHHYCRGDNDTGVLQIRSRFDFKNLDTQPLILYEGSSRIDRMMVAENEEDLRLGRFLPGIGDAITDSVAVGEPIRTLKIREIAGPTACGFTLLRPDASFATTGLILVPFRRAGTKGPHFLDTGAYLVRVQVETWPDYALLLTTSGRGPDGSDVRAVLFDRWKSWGSLWTKQSITSEPISVTIEVHPRLESCK
jgi:hypothetical protein